MEFLVLLNIIDRAPSPSPALQRIKHTGLITCHKFRVDFSSSMNSIPLKSCNQASVKMSHAINLMLTDVDV